MTSLFERFRSEVHRRLSGESYRVLVAEDHADLANVISALLRHCGFDVRSARDGRLVLAMARAFRPHFVLLDIKLPGLGGHEVAAAIRADPDLGRTVIVGISAYRPEGGSASPETANFDHYLRKPVELETLLAILLPGRHGDGP